MADNPAEDTLLTLTADIVAAHVSNNSVAVNDLPNLIQNVHSALSGISATAPAAEEKPQPAVSVRSSIKPDYITCLECGQKQKMLKRHLSTAHGQSPAEYRQRFGLATIGIEDVELRDTNLAQRKGNRPADAARPDQRHGKRRCHQTPHRR